MTHRMTRRGALALCAAPAFSLQNEQNDWQDLFDGQTLKGWRWARPGETGSPSWEVRDGLLRGAPGLAKDVYLLSESEFSDFELRFEWRCAPKGNSGIKYRVQRYGDSARRLEPTGLEYQITDDEANPDALSTPKHCSGAIYDYIAPTKTTPAKAGLWHQGRIVARALHIEHWLDGERVVNVDLDSEAARQQFDQSNRIESRRILRLQEKRQSPIALQIHDEEICFRSIRVKRLA